MSFPKAGLRRAVAMVVLAGVTLAVVALAGVALAATSGVAATAHGGSPARATNGATAPVHAPVPRRRTLVVATYNVDGQAPDAGTRADLRTLLAQADVLVVQEVKSAAKHAVIAQVQAETGVKVVYSPGGGEAILWHPDKVGCKTQGSVLLSAPTSVGNPSMTIPAKYLTWCRFRLRGTATSFQLGVLQLVPKSHGDLGRASLLKLEVANLAKALVVQGFTRPLVGGDFNLDYHDPALDPLRNVGMLNDQRVLGAVNTFPASAPATSFDQWWFRRSAQTGLQPLQQRTFAGSSDHLASVVTFAVR
jgi:hypothetical protein